MVTWHLERGPWDGETRMADAERVLHLAHRLMSHEDRDVRELAIGVSVLLAACFEDSKARGPRV